jgi:hypothetical protein
MRVVEWPSYQAGFREEKQCSALKLALDYYG